MIFIREEAGYRYYLNPSKPNKKFRLGQVYQGVRKSHNREQKILITKYSMISEKALDNLKKHLQILQTIRDSVDIPSSILKYYNYFYNLAQSNLYIISQYFDKFIPLQLKELHPVNLITIVSKQILSAFQYLQSIQLFTTYFNIFVNDDLQVKIVDFGFELAVNSLNFQYQTQPNACVDWVWGYVPSQKNKQIYDEFVLENLIELNDQRLEKQKTQKLYTWLYGLIIYNKLCSTLLNDQKYKIKNSTGEFWYPWCYLLRCLFIKKQIIDYNKNYKMISRDILKVLKKFQTFSNKENIMQNIMEQTQLSTQFFQFFTHSHCISPRGSYSKQQILSDWVKMLVDLLKAYVFQPFYQRITVSEIKKIIHGPSQENNQLSQSITKFYLVDHLHDQMQGLGQGNLNRQAHWISQISEDDAELQTWLRKFEFEPENGKEKASKKKQKISLSEKQLWENAKQILLPFLKSIFLRNKQLKHINRRLMNRLAYLDLYQQMFKIVSNPGKQSENKSKSGYKIVLKQNIEQLQSLKPLIKQLILIGIYLEIISILNELKYSRNQHEEIKSNAMKQLEQKKDQLNINYGFADAIAREQNKYNGQVSLYVKIRHSLKVKLFQLHKVLCQYNYLMDSYLSKQSQQQQHMGQPQQSPIRRRDLQTFFKKVTALIVISKIHEKVLSANQFQPKNNKQNLLQYKQFSEQYRKITDMLRGYAYRKMNQTQVNSQLESNQLSCLFSYFVQLIALIFLGCLIRLGEKLQRKLIEGISSHTMTFIASFLKQSREIMGKSENLIQVGKGMDKLKRVVQYLKISGIFTPDIST